MTTPLTIEVIRSALRDGAVALRRLPRLRPAGGDGDKVFPPTYEGGEYALEERMVEGRRVPCVLLDSVQSQANRIEQALKRAFYRGVGAECDIPVVSVDFAAAGLPEVGDITSLDAPHRVADAILRDSLLAGQPFRKTPTGQILDRASPSAATGLFGLCPTALVLGLWDSTGPRGGLGTKFQRCLVAEIVGVDVQQGVRPASRIDPLGIERNAVEAIYAAEDGWTLDSARAIQDKGKPVKKGKDGKPSEINHGNVTPSLRNKDKQLNHGGVTLAFARQSAVLSLPALRRLRFPDASGQYGDDRDLAARTALAALAVAGVQLSIQAGCDLRSRCLLIPDPEHPAPWEMVDAEGRAHPLGLPDPVSLVQDAARQAVAAGLPAWRGRPLVLQPQMEFAELVRRNRLVVAQSSPEA